MKDVETADGHLADVQVGLARALHGFYSFYKSLCLSVPWKAKVIGE